MTTAREKAKRQEKQARTGYTITEASSHWFVDDINIPLMKPKGLTGFVVIMYMVAQLCKEAKVTDKAIWILKPLKK